MLRKFIVTRSLEAAEKNPALAYDLALALHFMDFSHRSDQRFGKIKTIAKLIVGRRLA